MPPSSWGITAPPWAISDATATAGSGSVGIGLGNISNSPRQVASTVVAGMQQVTSSVRFLLIGCFQCSSSVRANGCWSRRREETDRTWFDCEQLQGDAPFCYVNPVALDSQDATPTTSSLSPQHQGGRAFNSIPPKPPTQKRRKFSAPNGNIPIHLPIVKRIQSKGEKIKQYSRAPKMTLSPIMNKSPKLARRNTTNGNIIQSPLQSLETAVKVDPERRNDNDVLSKVSKAETEKKSHVVSFAAQLEQSLRKLEQDIQRSGGEYIRSNITTQEFDTVVESPLEEGSTVFREDEFPDFESQIPTLEEEIAEDLNHIKRDIWKSSELEDAFECYNMAAFHTFGQYKGVDSTTQQRNQTEKYQEVFPPNIHSLSSNNNETNIDNYNNNNNDNTIINQNKTFKSESSCEKDDQGNVELKESETDLDDKQKSLTEKEVIHIINICAFENDFDDAHEQLIKNGLICDELFLYGGRSFNINLIYDLVKTTMCECNEIYKISMALCETYPIEKVQKRVITYLEKKIDDTTLTPSGIQAFRNAIDPSRMIDENSFKSALLAEKMIESVLYDESKEEGRIWKDVKEEEQEIKEAITNDIFNDLVSDSVSVLTNIFDLKMMF